MSFLRDRYSLEWPEEYLTYIDLFNRGEYFEAHEVLEDLWVVEVEPLKTYYKGLIQIAVAICHWERGNPSGAVKLYQSGMAYLAIYPEEFEGLDLRELRKRLIDIFAPLLHERTFPMPAEGIGLTLQIQQE
ncbi:DUF309 domain-containing protein [bacterium]|nr:DUF309 domain-containing protein [bacterium]